jgi:hypothetical protein
MRRDTAKPLKSEPDRFVLTIFGVVVLILSFGMTLVFFGKWDQIGSDQRDLTAVTSVTTGNGLRLIFPVAQKSDHQPDRAFDGSTAADSFWEANGPFPIELTIELPEPTILSSYALDAGEDASRMPSEWSVEGSQDGQSWILLDRQTVKEPWAPNQSQRFQVGYKQPLSQLHFRFLSGFNKMIFRIYEIELN